MSSKMIPTLRYRGFRSCSCDPCQDLVEEFLANMEDSGGDVEYSVQNLDGAIMMTEDRPGSVSPHEVAINRVLIGANSTNSTPNLDEGYSDYWRDTAPVRAEDQDWN